MSNKILIVDDDPVMARGIHRILSDRYPSVMVSSGSDALEYLKKYKADLILLDVNMPGMDGFETLEQIRLTDNGSDTPVIFLTSTETEDTEIRCLEAGAADFITKPVVPQILNLRVSHIIELDRLQNNLSEAVDEKTKELNEQSEKLELMSMQMVQALSDTIDAKDTYTNGHSYRVADYSLEMARRYGYSREKLNEVYITGMLHDVGKIGVPDTIINKTGKLTDEEYAIMKTHPAIGAHILEKITTIPFIAIGAHYHHERYDGRGYPDGLKGEDIPEIARIVGVADAYDAMTSRRSYRDVMPQDLVRQQIEGGKGSQFDPVFADIMLKMIDEDTNYIMREF